VVVAENVRREMMD